MIKSTLTRWLCVLCLSLGLPVSLLAQEAGAPEAAPGEPTQEPAAAEPPAEGDQFAGVEEIIVTSTKRAASVQDVPIAVTAITSEGLEARGIADVKDLQQVAPSLTITDSNSSTNGGTIRIRGMGTSGNNPGLESAVGSFIDGVYRSRAGLALQDLIDVERVEVLRGPQGTLFGKNTSAGLVHVITKQPEFEWGGHVSGSVGNFDLRRVQGSITGPVVEEKLAFRLAGTLHVRDGYYKDIDTDDTFSDRDRWALKGQLLWTPTDNFDTRVIGDFTKMREHCCPATYWVSGLNANHIIALGGDAPTPIDQLDDDSLNVGTNEDPQEDVDDWGISVESNWDLDWVRVKSILAYRDTDIFRSGDIDFTNADILRRNDTREDWKNWSFELQFGGNVDSANLDWLVGFYAYTEDLENSTQVRFATQGPEYVGRLVAQNTGVPILGAIIQSLTGVDEGRFSAYSQETKGYSVFTHNIFQLTEQLSLTVGARYGWEEKKGSGIHDGVPVGSIANAPFCDRYTAVGAGFISLRETLNSVCDNFSYASSFTNDDWTGTLQLGYAITPDINIYGSAARGFKAGGYNLDSDAFNCRPLALASSLQPTPTSVVSGTGPGAVWCEPSDATTFDPEFSYNYELGAKMQFWDGRVTLNTAFFTTIFKGFQLNTFTGLGFIISNVNRVKAQGGELELTLVPFDGVIGNFSVTYADTRYGDDTGVCFELQRPDLSVNRCNRPDLGPGGVVTGTFFPNDQLADGHRITQSPAWSGSLALSVQKPLFGTGWFWYGGGNLYYRGRHKTSSDLDPLKMEDAYTKLNLQAGFRSPDEKLDLQVWANNVTDEIVNTGIFDSVFQAGSTSAFKQAPRMYGFTATYHFGE